MSFHVTGLVRSLRDEKRPTVSTRWSYGIDGPARSLGRRGEAKAPARCSAGCLLGEPAPCSPVRADGRPEPDPISREKDSPVPDVGADEYRVRASHQWMCLCTTTSALFLLKLQVGRCRTTTDPVVETLLCGRDLIGAKRPLLDIHRHREVILLHDLMEAGLSDVEVRSRLNAPAARMAASG